jgi:hypothetical protein
MVVIDQDEANRSVGLIHRKSMELIERMTKVQLWPSAREENHHAEVHGSDPPMLQLLFKMRDHFNAIPPEEIHSRTIVLRTMTILSKDLHDVAVHTATTLVDSLWKLKTMEQAEKHHADKMRLEEKKLSPDRPPTTSELILAARQRDELIETSDP